MGLKCPCTLKVARSYGAKCMPGSDSVGLLRRENQLLKFENGSSGKPKRNAFDRACSAGCGQKKGPDIDRVAPSWLPTGSAGQCGCRCARAGN